MMGVRSSLFTWLAMSVIDALITIGKNCLVHLGALIGYPRLIVITSTFVRLQEQLRWVCRAGRYLEPSCSHTCVPATPSWSGSSTAFARSIKQPQLRVANIRVFRQTASRREKFATDSFRNTLRETWNLTWNGAQRCWHGSVEDAAARDELRLHVTQRGGQIEAD